MKTIIQSLVLAGLLAAACSAQVFVAGVPNSYQISYAANLLAGDSYIDLTNNGAASTVAFPTQNGNICANVYTYDPSEELVSCCACPITPNGLVSLSAKQDLVSNTLTPGVPGSIVVKLIASTQVGACNAAGNANSTLTDGLVAWATTLSQNTVSGNYELTRVQYTPATLSAAELTRMQTLCGFIQANGSGFGICKSCRLGALGGAQQ